MAYLVLQNRVGTTIPVTVDISDYFSPTYIIGNANVDNLVDGYVTVGRNGETRTINGTNSGKYYWEITRENNGNVYVSTGVTNGTLTTTGDNIAHFYNYSSTSQHIGVALDADNKTLRYVVSETIDDADNAVERTGCFSCSFSYGYTGLVYPSVFYGQAGSGTCNWGFRAKGPLFGLKSAFPWLANYQPLDALYH